MAQLPRVLSIVAAMALLVLAGCRLPVDRNVLLVGDSLLAMSVDEIAAELLMADDAGYFVMTNAIAGTTYGEGDTGAAYWVGRAPLILAEHRVDEVVISLGTNDVIRDALGRSNVSSIELEAAANRLLDAYQGRRVLWILPHDQVRVNWGGSGRYERVVDAIKRAAAGRSSVRVVSFSDYVASRGIDIAELCVDGAHFNEAGRRFWAQFIHERLAER